MPQNLDAIVSAAIDRLNELLPTGEPVGKDPSVVLLGEEAVLDSMGFVNLVVAVETEVQEKLGVQILLADRVAADSLSHFTVGDLVNLLGKMLSSR